MAVRRDEARDHRAGSAAVVENGGCLGEREEGVGVLEQSWDGDVSGTAGEFFVFGC